LKLASSLAERGEFDTALSFLDTLSPPQGLPDARGFAWYYLDRLVRPRISMLPPLPSRVRAVAHALDGLTIALTDDANRTFLMDRDTGAIKELPGKHRVTVCHRLVFSPDGRTLASLSHGVVLEDFRKREVKLWDVASGAELEGMAENFGLCYQILFSPDGGTLVTVETVPGNPGAPVRSWRLSGDRKRVALGESLRVEELAARLSAATRVADSARGPFQLSDVLAVTPGDDSTVAVSLETGEVWLYTAAGGYCKAVCRVEGPERGPRSSLFPAPTCWFHTPRPSSTRSDVRLAP
jgi:WD40 repeat protein